MFRGCGRFVLSFLKSFLSPNREVTLQVLAEGSSGIE